MKVRKEPNEVIYHAHLCHIYNFSVATFGFDANQYSVIEDARFVTVTICQVSGGILDRNVLTTLQTGDGTAILCK